MRQKYIHQGGAGKMQVKYNRNEVQDFSFRAGDEITILVTERVIRGKLLEYESDGFWYAPHDDPDGEDYFNFDEVENITGREQ